MSDEPRVPDPDANPSEGTQADLFSDMNVQPIDIEFPGDPSRSPLGDFIMPNPDAHKPKWYERFRKAKSDGNSPRPPKPRKPMPIMANSKLHKALVDLYMGMGIMLMPIYPEIASQVTQNAERCADAWVELAATNPAVKRFLVALVTTSATGALIMAHLPILIAVTMQFVPGMKERQNKMFADFASQMSANIPTTDEGGEK